MGEGEDMKRERIIVMKGGHDCIRFECIHGNERCVPGEGGSHGVGGLMMWFVLKGEEGAVQFMLGLGWFPQYSKPDRIGVRNVECKGQSYPYDLGYHSKVARYDGAEVSHEACPYCDGEACYYDGSGLNANDAMYAMCNGGGEGLWKFLDEYYDSVFHGGDYPKPVEYKMPLRKGVKI